MDKFIDIFTRTWPVLVGGAAGLAFLTGLVWNIRGMVADIHAASTLTRAELAEQKARHEELRADAAERHRETSAKLDKLESGAHQIDTRVTVLERMRGGARS